MLRRLFWSAAFVPLLADAGVRHYEAPVESAAWNINGSPLECSLSHDIPRYGEAVFTSKAGEPLNLSFELNMLRVPTARGEARLLSLAPTWRAASEPKDLGAMTVRRHLDGDLNQPQAWNMLDELDKGMRPTLMFDNNYRASSQVAVSLTSVNFHQNYQAFLSCMDQLLPFSFDDIAYSILTYQKSSDALSRESKKRLGMIAEYLKHDPSIELVLIDAFSDSFGSRNANDVLSRKRGNVIRQFFVDQGIDGKRIKVEAHGERRHIASNRTERGRQINRRVVIQMRK